MYLRTAATNLQALQAVFRAYLQTQLEEPEIMLRLQVPLNFEKNPDRKYVRAAQMTARGMAGVENYHLFTPYIKIGSEDVEILHGSGSMRGGADLACMLPTLYPKVLQLEAMELENIAAFELADFSLRLYGVYQIGLEQLDAFNLQPETLQHIKKLPKEINSLVIRISSENVHSESLLRQYEEMLISQLFCQFRDIQFERLTKISELAAQNGVLTYKLLKVHNLDDLRLECNNYVENYKDASKVFLGSMHTRLQNAVNCDWQGTANAFESGGIYVDFAWEMCELGELFETSSHTQAVVK